MKKLILIALVIVPFLANNLSARTIIKRTKSGCVPGCGTTSRVTDKEPYTIDETTGEVTEWTYSTTITCSGTGFQSCPTERVAPGEPTEIDPFSLTNGNLLFDHALNQIDLGVSNGNYSMNFLNTVTGQLWKFTAIWTTINGVETIIVNQDLIS